MPRINTDNDKYYGIGDLACLAWIAEGTRDTSDPIAFHARPGTKFSVLELFGQNVADHSEDRGACVYQAYENELKDLGRKRRVDYLRDVLGIATPLVRPRVHIPAEDLEWARRTQAEIGGEELVLIFPQTHWVPREWPACYWNDLGWQLVERSVPTLTMLTHEDRRYTNMPRFFWGFPLTKVAALMSVASLVVALDSGPAHLAATIGVPTIVLMGPTRAECVFGHVPEVMALTSRDLPGCAGCHFGVPFRVACDQGCQTLYALLPHVVLAKIVSELALIRRRPRRTLSALARVTDAAN